MLTVPSGRPHSGHGLSVVGAASMSGMRDGAPALKAARPFGSALRARAPRSRRPTSTVPAAPPRSAVRGPSRSTSSIARDDRVVGLAVARVRRPASAARKASIIAPDQIIAIGLAMPLPAMSGAEPCTGSNSDGNVRSGFRLPDGARPIVPVQAGPRSDRMSPNRFDATTTSKRSGCSTKRAVRMSMCCLSTVTSGYSAWMASARPSHHGMLMAMPFDLVATVRCLRARARWPARRRSAARGRCRGA